MRKILWTRFAMLSRTSGRLFAAAAMTLIVPATAAAQQQPASGTPQNTPVQGTVGPIESGFLIAPDAKITQVNDRSATLVGAYGGWMTEHTVLIGAGGYWLANDARDFDMAYGGPVVEWLVHGNRTIAFGARGLVGGGRATLSGTLGDLFGVRTNQEAAASIDRGGRHGRPVVTDGRRTITSASIVVVRDDFFIAEPQAIVSMRAARWLHVDAGVGYRLIAGAENLNDRLRGVSGTLSVKFGGG
jgi:hypothetical protein